jgi:penicillin-binding protein 1A
VIDPPPPATDDPIGDILTGPPGPEGPAAETPAPGTPSPEQLPY